MFLWKKKIPPGQVIIAGFIGVILVGALLLMLPFATKDGGGASFLDALFTSVSATCVTGLVRHDTYTYWSVFGQAVILGLIQVGGMGVVTIAVTLSILTGRRIGLSQRYLMQEAISAPQVGGIVRITGFIFRTTLAVEGIGACLLAIRFCPQYGVAAGLWYAVFHSISAFCNAGFDLMGRNMQYASLTAYAGDPLVSVVIALLIVVGGIGFFVWDDIWTHGFRVRRYRLQTKLALAMTGFLLVVPGIILFLFEFGRDVWGFDSAGERLLAALFQTVTPRTAGFNTVDLTLASEPMVLLLILLMLVGGSPSSTAGGMKTTTAAAMLLSIRAVFNGKDSICCFGRRIPQTALRQAVSIFSLYLMLFLAGGSLICALEDIPLKAALFETASAIGTVGLSLGITDSLGSGSCLILIGLMFFGRVGGLTMLYAVMGNHTAAPYQMPKENITVG